MATPTHTTEVIDLSWVEFSDQDSNCCQNRVPCSKEAIWHMALQCDCVQQYDFCDPCNKVSEEYLEMMFSKCSYVICVLCGGKATTYTVTPIKR